jgi:hypothetical protein
VIAHSLLSLFLACLLLPSLLPVTVQAKTDLSWPPPQEVISADSLRGEGQGYSAPKEGHSPDAVATPPGDQSAHLPQPPDDPCLPRLYKDWRELGQDTNSVDLQNGFARVRIVINRAEFELVLEGIRKDESVEEIYRTPIALGDIDSPTPGGEFIINHVYCYPDVLFFPADADPIPGLYGGFFAPLLVCDRYGRCERFLDLGLHGFQASALPHHTRIRVATYGAVTAGCIRLPDPCKFKSLLVAAVGLGPLKKNKRGSYHWLNKPVHVLIIGSYPGTEDQTTIASLVEQGLVRFRDGLKDLLGAFQ